jgi:hypothetical protein
MNWEIAVIAIGLGSAFALLLGRLASESDLFGETAPTEPRWGLPAVLPSSLGRAGDGSESGPPPRPGLLAADPAGIDRRGGPGTVALAWSTVPTTRQSAGRGPASQPAA